MKKRILSVVIFGVLCGLVSCQRSPNNADADVYEPLEFGELSRNNVFSPISLELTLAMISSGAFGETREQLLGYLNTNRKIDDTAVGDVNALYAELIQALNRDGQKNKLSASNSLWVGKNLSVETTFKNYINSDYYGDVFDGIDFLSKNGKVIKAVNEWIGKSTSGLIADAINKELLPDTNTAALVINTLYFKDAWDQEFSVIPNWDFTASGGTVTKVDGLKGVGYHYFEDEEAQVGVVAMTQSSFMIILPKGEVTRPFIEAAEISEYLAKVSREVVDISMPAFKITIMNELTDYVRNSGVAKIFDSNGSEFDGLKVKNNTLNSIYVSKIIQQCYVDVNQYGVEAAATTIAEMRDGAAKDSKRAAIVANKPFYFAIIDNVTNEVLFTGAIVNPQ